MNDEEMNDEWKGPNENDIEWTITMLEQIEIGGVWAPVNSGVEYSRTGEKEISLTRLMNHPSAGAIHARVVETLEKTDWVMKEDQAELVTPPLDPIDAIHERKQREQEIAERWRCPTDDCDALLRDMSLENGIWTYEGMQQALTDDGEIMDTERWSVRVNCHTCGATIALEPYDYTILGGDELSWRWGPYEVMVRERIIDAVDNNEQLLILGTHLEHERVPPHMRGLVVYMPINMEEE